MNPCERFKRHISDFIDDEMDPVQRKAVEKHIHMCHQCATKAEQIELVRKSLQRLTRQKCSDDFNVLLRARIRREGQKKTPRFTLLWEATPRWVPAMGLGVIILVTSVWVFQGREQAQSGGPLLSKTVPVPEQSQVRYMMDEAPERMAVSGTETRESAIPVIKDTIDTRRDNARNLRQRATPVNF